MRHALAWATALLLVALAPAADARGIVTSINHEPSVGDESLQYLRNAQANARMTRMTFDWRDIAPSTRPAGFAPADPDSAGYHWAYVDKLARAADAAGLTIQVTINRAPGWAETTRAGAPGTRSPDPAALAAFAMAAARRFDGTRPGLPRIRHWEVWNEPNASFALRPPSPVHYRRMVDAAADAFHAVDPGATVIAGATYPFTTRQGSTTAIGPKAFFRDFACFDPEHRSAATCDRPARFDAWSVHPYTSGGPTHQAQRSDDVSMGDLREMRRLLDRAHRADRIAGPRPALWITEMSWDSRPPDPRGVPSTLLRHWTAEALYRAWKAEVAVFTWFLMRDQRDRDRFQSGLYRRCSKGPACDRPKSHLRAFRFPFVAFRSGSRARVWGRLPGPRAERVRIQRRIGKRWRTVARATVRADGTFSRRFRISRRATSLRARASGGPTSPAFPLKRPPDMSVNPFGS